MSALITAQTVSAAIAIGLAAGCPNPNYRPDALGTCSIDQHCSEPTPVCDPITNTCVQCTPDQPSACSEATPVCGETSTCRPCRADEECPSQVCQLSGRCLPEDQALYVSPVGAESDCTASQPCTLQTALTQFTAKRFAIKLAPGTYRGAIIVGNNQRLEIHGDGADLTRGEPGPIVIVEVKGLAELTVLGLRIHHSLQHGISCADDLGNQPTMTLHRARIDSNPGLGISALGCKLHVLRSQISMNPGGGIRTEHGTFAIVGNVFFANGAPLAGTGGLSADYLSATSRLEFNTFHSNLASDGRGSAIDCSGGTFTAQNNILSFNGLAGSAQQVRGCTHEYSLVYPGPVLPGIGNSSTDPWFKAPDAQPPDLHLMAGSPARAAADLGADLTGPAALDIDGDERTSPADIGADEVP
ncbi:MAG TPA: right-handed parallel beta-helix repeat-containing protein [Kofleriaceae bacterium]|nr:right-handed parallel beta-helix repeat-containing protein [Kofleriaceae bacterium]